MSTVTVTAIGPHLLYADGAHHGAGHPVTVPQALADKWIRNGWAIAVEPETAPRNETKARASKTTKASPAEG